MLMLIILGRFGLYANLPYSPIGARVVRIASWNPSRGLYFHDAFNIFPQKYSKYDAIFETLPILNHLVHVHG